MSEMLHWVGKELGVRVVACMEANQLERCALTGIECWTQKFEFGAKDNKGSLLNHSDYKLNWKDIDKQSRTMRNLNREVCVCVGSVKEAMEIGDVWDYLAFEPEELIGDKQKSVATEKPNEIKEIVNIWTKRQVLIGAGIHSRKDIRVGLEMGARGFLVSSDVVTAKDPEKQFRELVEEFVNFQKRVQS
jgi:triosephosphate isomerase